MIAHVSIHVSNYEKSKEFYLKTLKPLGYEAVMDLPEYKSTGFGVRGSPDFWVIEKPSVTGSEHAAILVGDKSAVDAFHKAALEAGGKDNGAPGIRQEYSLDYYAAFVFDLDGNNIEAVTFK
jgi:catechol 2,3-dioxygenase-like lactoylglutathione lyase family enzyme